MADAERAHRDDVLNDVVHHRTSRNETRPVSARCAADPCFSSFPSGILPEDDGYEKSANEKRRNCGHDEAEFGSASFARSRRNNLLSKDVVSVVVAVVSCDRGKLFEALAFLATE
jgi:hypothetical protein